jgi:two-component system response regulator LytT
MPIKAMIAEDEHLAREELAYLIRQEEDVELCPSAENGQQLLQLYRRYRPDVIFLDIEMPKRSGIDAARRIREDSRDSDGTPPLFVFTTAYDEYAVQAFDLEAVDYLLKPFDPERLHEAMARVRKALQLSRAMSERNRAETFSKKESDRLPNGKEKPPSPSTDSKLRSSKLLVEDGEKVVVLDPAAICYAVRVNRRVAIHTEKEVIYAKITLQELEEMLRNYPFYRSHRSYLVNLDYIKEIVPWFNGACNLILKNKEDTKIPVSRSAVKPLFELLRQY